MDVGQVAAEAVHRRKVNIHREGEGGRELISWLYGRLRTGREESLWEESLATPWIARASRARLEKVRLLRNRNKESRIRGIKDDRTERQSNFFLYLPSSLHPQMKMKSGF